MNRRRFVGGVAVGCVVAPFAARGQQAARVPRVGVLALPPLENPDVQVLADAFRQGLRERGYVEGQNIVVEYRSAGGKAERLHDLASELVGLKVDVIVVGGAQLVHAVQQVTTTVPIVGTALFDPVEDGFATSLARPGRNITGLTFLGPELVPKRLELLKQMLPAASRIAGLWQPGAFGEDATKEMLREAEAAARTMGVQLQLKGVRVSNELEGAFSAIVRERPDALIVFPSNVFFFERQSIAELTARHRLPSMHYAREFVAVGGLISYGPSLADLWRRGGAYVDKILKGARPGDLPIEQPNKFDLVINLKTAKALGINIPQSLGVRANEIVQ